MSAHVDKVTRGRHGVLALARVVDNELRLAVPAVVDTVGGDDQNTKF